MSKFKQVHLVCSHDRERDLSHMGRRVPDYHPLTRRQVRLLLKRAQQTGSSAMRASIEIRLLQGMPEQTCPVTIAWHWFVRRGAISDLYRGHKFNSPNTRIANALYNAIGGDPHMAAEQ